MLYKEREMISVIIPLYNVEKHIARCLDSILSQTFQNFEIIIVNDGSLDDSFNIVRSYKERDKRIKIMENKVNMGQSWTRMVGYMHASGDYYVFCDSDDYMPKDALLTLYNGIEENDADIVVGNFQLVYSDGKYGKVSKNVLSYGEDQRSVYKSLLSNEMSHSLWGKIYKKELFRERHYITHKNFTNGEDGFLLYQIIRNCKRISAITNVVYYYYYNKESVTKINLSEKSLKAIVLFWNLIEDMFVKDSELYSLVKKRNIEAFLSLLNKGYTHEVLSEYVGIEELRGGIKLSLLLNHFSIIEALKKYMYFKYCKIRKHTYFY